MKKEALKTFKIMKSVKGCKSCKHGVDMLLAGHSGRSIIHCLVDNSSLVCYAHNDFRMWELNEN